MSYGKLISSIMVI